MNTPKISLIENIVGNLKIDIRKLFDKGEIDKLYWKMYLVADELSYIETKRWMAKRAGEWRELLADKLAERLSNREKDTLGDGELNRLMSVKPLANYRNKRLKVHLDYMFRLLELYVKSKANNETADMYRA